MTSVWFLTDGAIFYSSRTVSVTVSVLTPKLSVAFGKMRAFFVSKNHTNTAVLVRYYIDIAYMFNAACLRLYFAWAWWIPREEV